ncbi:MAG TPA: hypothetical protein VH496_10825 [Mycobacterium sp.]|jgi:hypothetical protein
MSPGGVVILDDMMPRNSLEAFRNCEATGSYLIVGLDLSSTVLDDAYEDLVPTLTAADPQTVPEDWLHRRESFDPHQIADSDVWDEVVALRTADAQRSAYEPLWKKLAALPRLGDLAGDDPHL